MSLKLNEELFFEIIPELKVNGTGSHLVGPCPFCSKPDHLYIQRKTKKKTSFGKNSSFYWHCKKCNEAGGPKKLFRKVGRLDLINFSKSIDFNRIEKIDFNAVGGLSEEELLSPKVKPPIMYKRCYSSPYLDSRGITDFQYQYFNFGTSNFSKFRNYIFCLITDKDKFCYGYVGRCTLPKEEMEGKFTKYKNSSKAGFSKLMLGYEEVLSSGKCDTVIAVEGIFDKFRIDMLLNLYSEESVKCICLFGKNFSPVQVEKLRRSGVKNVIWFIDNDAVKETKRQLPRLNQIFTMEVMLHSEKGFDPGDLKTSDQFWSIYDNRKNYFQFSQEPARIKT